MPRLLVAISAHGLGHLGQAAPVCNALAALLPDLTLTIWSALPLPTLRQRIHAPFSHVPDACDIGFVMHDALNVDIPSSWQRYLQREATWAAQLHEACEIVRKCKPDLIVSDVGEMPLAAGQALRIPTVAMSSLNWADLARSYFSALPDNSNVLARLDDIYAFTTLALRLTPGMPMHGQREVLVPPVGAVSPLSRLEIDPNLQAYLPFPDKPRILIGMGGIETRLPWMDWSEQSAFNFVIANQPTLPAEGDAARGLVNADILRDRFGWNFCDLLVGCDAVICKPGYGTFVEAALAGVPVLYIRRSDWPEQPVLVEWLHKLTRCAELAPGALMNGDFTAALHALWQQPPKASLPQDGAEQAALEILSFISSPTASFKKMPPVSPPMANHSRGGSSYKLEVHTHTCPIGTHGVTTVEHGG